MPKKAKDPLVLRPPRTSSAAFAAPPTLRPADTKPLFADLRPLRPKGHSGDCA